MFGTIQLENHRNGTTKSKHWPTCHTPDDRGCRARHDRSPAPSNPGKGGARVRTDRAAAIHAPATAAAICMRPREPPFPLAGRPHHMSPRRSRRYFSGFRGSGGLTSIPVPSSSVEASATAGARCPWMPSCTTSSRGPREGGMWMPNWCCSAKTVTHGGTNDRSSQLPRTPQLSLFSTIVIDSV